MIGGGGGVKTSETAILGGTILRSTSSLPNNLLTIKIGVILITKRAKFLTYTSIFSDFVFLGSGSSTLLLLGLFFVASLLLTDGDNDPLDRLGSLEICWATLKSTSLNPVSKIGSAISHLCFCFVCKKIKLKISRTKNEKKS